MGDNMENKIEIDFYHDKDEDAFLNQWEAKYGPLEDEALDELYLEIAKDIQQQIEEEKHKLGDKYMYQEVFVGYSDYNAFNQLYLFSQSPK